MGDYDAASVAGHMAGLGEEHPPVTPEQLTAAFCANRDADYIGERATHGTVRQGDGYTTVDGFCGYNGRRDTKDSLLTGFDDGYDFMGYLEERGWAPDTGMGDWPYVVYLQCKGQPLVYVSYCEADFTVLRFDNQAALARFRYADKRLRG